MSILVLRHSNIPLNQDIQITQTKPPSDSLLNAAYFLPFLTLTPSPSPISPIVPLSALTSPIHPGVSSSIFTRRLPSVSHSGNGGEMAAPRRIMANESSQSQHMDPKKDGDKHHPGERNHRDLGIRTQIPRNGQRLIRFMLKPVTQSCRIGQEARGRECAPDRLRSPLKLGQEGRDLVVNAPPVSPPSRLKTHSPGE
ncbi:hypothetical protein BJX70DRAFT_395483 [Aspergillus crustosus]